MKLFRAHAHDRRCPRCFTRYLPRTQVCPQCLTQRQPIPQALPAGSVLKGRYQLGEAVARAADGVVYAAWDQRRSRQVFLRELFPPGLFLRQADGTLDPAPDAPPELIDDAIQAFARAHRRSFAQNGTWYALQKPPAPAAPSPAPAPPQCQAGHATHPGSRQRQEDSAEVIVGQHVAYGVLCDGMGGLQNGAQASGECVRLMLQAHQALCFGPEASILPQLRRSAEAANHQLSQLRTPEGARMACGSTLVCAVLRGGLLYYLSVGDSRIYLIRGGTITQLNREHTLTQLLLSRGSPPPSSGGGALTSYIGMGHRDPLLIDQPPAPIPLRSSDCVLLCSDGLYRALTDEELVAIVRQGPDPATAARQLIAAALARQLPHQDNLTVIVLQYTQP